MAAPPRLLVSLPAEPDTRARVDRRLPGLAVEYHSGPLEAPRPTVEALLVGNVDRELPGLRPEHLPGLRFVQVTYTGLDNVPFDRFGPAVVVAGNVGAYAPFVAEHAVAMVLSLARDLSGGHAQVLAGRLRPTPLQRFLGGKVALVVGYGEIGREVATRLRAGGMSIVGVGRTDAPRPGADRMVTLAGLAAELPGAAVVVNALPLTRSTRRVFDAARLARFSDESIFVNVGRAETVDPVALERRLASTPGFRVGFDVWWEEDYRAGTLGRPFALERYPNLLASPHRAPLVPEARGYALDRALENLARFVAGERPRYVADRNDYRRD